MAKFAIFFLLLSFAGRLWAIDAVDFDDPMQLERYQQLSAEMRCPKCQNQNLIDSNSPISIDLRREIARLVKSGKTDEEIKSHMVSLHGDYILYQPPVQTNTYALWAAPFVMLSIGLLVLVVVVVKRSKMGLEDGPEDGTDDDGIVS